MTWSARSRSFNELLRAHRVGQSLTQEQLAERAGVTAKAIGALERGERRRPYRHTVQALSDALGLDEHDRTELAAAVPYRAGSSAASSVAPVGRGAQAATGWARPPEPAGPVIGRDPEGDEISARLGTGTRRIVTLTGPGGVGKTTLALVVAARAQADYTDGVLMVELDEIRRPDRVMAAIGKAVGVPEPGFDGTTAALARFLAGRRMLVVLDNLEHVLSCGSDLAALVAACPELVVLATSRAPLRIRAEHQVRVGPLGPADALRLFHDRAAAAGVTLDDSERTRQAVAELCNRADGLPLALELAASATARLGPGFLHERADAVPFYGPRDLPARQRSMAATLDWSVSLLSRPARSLLARLSVCSGDFSLTFVDEIGEQISTDDPYAAIAALAELREHSLVTQLPDVEGTERFRMLAPVRQYAAKLSTPAERDVARSGLVRAALEVARSLGDDLLGAGQVAALRLLEADLSNLRVAFQQLLDEAQGDDAAELLWLTWQFLVIRGHAREGGDWARRLSELPLSEVGRARCQVAHAPFNLVTGDVSTMRRLSVEGLVHAQRVGDDGLSAEAAMLAATATAYEHDLPTALELLEQAELHADRSGHAWSMALTQLTRGLVALLAGDTNEAARLLPRAEVHLQALGNPSALAFGLVVQAVVASSFERYDEAAALLLEAAESSEASQDMWTMSYLVPVLAGVAVGLGDPVSGARLYGAAASYSPQYSALNFPAELLDQGLVATKATLGAAAFDEARRINRTATLRDITDVARALCQRARE